MAVDRVSSLRQRLRRETDTFDFGALIEGVSTLEEVEVSTVEAHVSDVASIVEPATQTPEAPVVVHTEPKEERLRTAVNSLGARLLDTAGKFRSEVREGDCWAAGACLSQLNQILELLHSVDPQGDVARFLASPGAPPHGSAWPTTAWSVAELAESPFSALLPQDADEYFVRRVVSAAWGSVFPAHS